MVQKVAIDKEDWDTVDKGGKPKKKAKVEIPTPESPEIPRQIKFDSIPLLELKGFTHTKRTAFNTEGVRFMGFDVVLTLEGKKPVEGWMSEADVLKLQQHRRS